MSSGVRTLTESIVEPALRTDCTDSDTWGTIRSLLVVVSCVLSQLATMIDATIIPATATPARATGERGLSGCMFDSSAALSGCVRVAATPRSHRGCAA